VKYKWVYRTKYVVDGSVDKYKEQFITKGSSQVEGIDYYETFGMVANMDYMCRVLGLATSHRREVH